LEFNALSRPREFTNEMIAKAMEYRTIGCPWHMIGWFLQCNYKSLERIVRLAKQTGMRK
jgi:hypothetical protein